MSKAREHLFIRRNPCPICGRYEGMPPGQGARRHGFHLSDGRLARCTREEGAA